jgi:hypothetical protein
VRYGNDSCGRSLGENGITLGTQQWFVTLKTNLSYAGRSESEWRQLDLVTQETERGLTSVRQKSSPTKQLIKQDHAAGG